MITGVVLAGGASARFEGKPKGLVPFRGRAMVLAVADVLAQVCERVVIEVPHDEAGYEALGLPLIQASAAHMRMGPLAGIVAGLVAQPKADVVAFAPCDMPLLNADVYRALLDEGGSRYARSPRGAEPLVAVLLAAALTPLKAALAGRPVPRTNVALSAAGAHAVWFDDAAPFANVNTPADLARLGGLAP